MGGKPHNGHESRIGCLYRLHICSLARKNIGEKWGEISI